MEGAGHRGGKPHSASLGATGPGRPELVEFRACGGRGVSNKHVRPPGRIPKDYFLAAKENGKYLFIHNEI